MAQYETHDFCGVTIYHCPHCKFDNASVTELRAHIWQRHEMPKNLAAAEAEQPQAELYGPAGELIQRIKRRS